VDGYLARTTLRRDLQVGVSDVVRRRLGDLGTNGIHNAAVLVLSNATGAVLAYVGNHPDLEGVEGGTWTSSASPGAPEHPEALPVRRHAGRRHAAPGPARAGCPHALPRLRAGEQHEDLPGGRAAYMALARSLNVPAVRLLREYGLDRFAGDLEAIGMSTLFRPAREYGLTLILGGAEGTLWDLTTMYAGLARSATGIARPFFDSTIWADRSSPEQGVEHYSTGASYLTLDALLRVLRPGAGIDWRSSPPPSSSRGRPGPVRGTATRGPSA